MKEEHWGRRAGGGFRRRWGGCSGFSRPIACHGIENIRAGKSGPIRVEISGHEERRILFQNQVGMTTGIEIDEEKKIIQRSVSGELYTERSLSLVRELALSLLTYKGYKILMDMRETETKPEMLDLMAIASECAKLRSGFNRKIAFLIPNTERRIRFAQLFKACMEAQSFEFRQFFDRNAALQWLSE